MTSTIRGSHRASYVISEAIKPASTKSHETRLHMDQAWGKAIDVCMIGFAPLARVMHLTRPLL